MALLLMALTFPLPTDLPGRIRLVAWHPLRLATLAWALAHLLVNVLLADVVLLGGFLARAAANRLSLRHRMPCTAPACGGYAL